MNFRKAYHPPSSSAPCFEDEYYQKPKFFPLVFQDRVRVVDHKKQDTFDCTEKCVLIMGESYFVLFEMKMKMKNEQQYIFLI